MVRMSYLKTQVYASINSDTTQLKRIIILAILCTPANKYMHGEVCSWKSMRRAETVL